MDAIALACRTALLLSRIRLSRGMLLASLQIGLVMLIFILGFSMRVESWGLMRLGLDMSILAVGTCLIIAATVQTGWKSPRLPQPWLSVGRRSYEIDLTHMFVVFAMFSLFLLIGKPMGAVIPFFVTVIVISAILGDLVARHFSEPINHLIRKRWS